MGIFNWLNKKLDNARIQTEPTKIRIAEEISETNCIYFTISKASGGYVVQHRSRNKKTHDYDVSLHIIREDQDIGEELGKIITFESLRN
jgi:hypothetical protein